MKAKGKVRSRDTGRGTGNRVRAGRPRHSRKCPRGRADLTSMTTSGPLLGRLNSMIVMQYASCRKIQLPMAYISTYLEGTDIVR